MAEKVIVSDNLNLQLKFSRGAIRILKFQESAHNSTVL